MASRWKKDAHHTFSVDDVLAILLALAAGKDDIEVLLLSVTHGNIDVEAYVTFTTFKVILPSGNTRYFIVLTLIMIIGV